VSVDSSEQDGDQKLTGRTKEDHLMAKIRRLQHAVFNCRDVETSMKFYTDALGMEVVSYDRERKMAFLSFGVMHHDIALFQFATDAPMLEANRVGLNHLALEIDGGEDQLKELYNRFKAQGVRIDRTTDHVMTRSVYFFDPDGNRLEIFCDLMPADAKQWLHDNGGVAKPWTPEKAETA
jgi:catechol 2,3-dioxygenase